MILEAYPRPDGYIDRRAFAGQVHSGQRARKRAWLTSTSWKKTTGCTLHQTACDMGERIERYDNTGAHVVVLRSGRWIHLHDLNKNVAHGNGWNAQCWSIEINGLFAGEVGGHVWDDPSTAIREKPMTPTPIQLQRTIEIVRWGASVIAANGGEMKVLCAHRQSSKDRPDDPGQEVWRGSALPVMAELGLTDGGVGFVIGTGRPIPETWDPRCRGVRY